jgi:hypothetical protein
MRPDDPDASLTRAVLRFLFALLASAFFVAVMAGLALVVNLVDRWPNW